MKFFFFGGQDFLKFLLALFFKFFALAGLFGEGNHVILVKDRDTLVKLSHCKASGSAMLANAGAAVVVIADTARSDVYIEDAAVAMTNMMLCATELGVGNCWVQCRNRSTAANDSGIVLSADECVRSILHIPEGYAVEAMLSLGMPKEMPQPHELPSLDGANVMLERFTAQR